MFNLALNDLKTRLYRISWGFVLAAVAATSLAGGAFLVETSAPRNFLSVDEPTRDLGAIPLGEERFLDFPVNNASNQPLLVHMIANQSC